MKDTVEISIAEYKDFIISQYKQGVVRSELLSDIENLERKKRDLEFDILKIKSEKQSMLDMLFKENRMGTDSRDEQLQHNVYSNGLIDYGSYFGFDVNARKLLFHFGFTLDDLLLHIGKRWDLKEKRDRGEIVNE